MGFWLEVTPSLTLPARGRVTSSSWRFLTVTTGFTSPLAGEARRGDLQP
jgi:hypothetical protein